MTLTSIQMIDRSNGWAIGGGVGAGDQLLRTADGGETWPILMPAIPALHGIGN